MGMVYKVEHMQLAKVAAMKVLHPEMARDAEAVRRFRTEAQAVSRLDHPNIVQTFDFGQWDEALYLVMEYLKGDDLAIIMKREGPLPFPRAARLFVQICSALTEAHESGVIHRDLKPENIVVIPRRDGTETAKVLDFGLAKLRERTEVSMATSGNQVIGTPYYMSPEQVRSEPLDVRTDIYSLGATLYRVLTGTPPFQATTPVGVLTKHVTDPLEPPRVRAPQLNLPPVADAILSRAMAKARDDRYPTAADVKRALEAALAELGAPASAAGARASGAARSAAATQPSRPPEAGSAGEARGSVGGSTGPTARGTGHAPTVDVADAVEPPAAARFRTGGRFLGRRGRAEKALEAEEPSDDGDLSVEEEAASGADRLRRQEFDAFERGLRRRRLTAVLGMPLLIAGAATLIGLRAFHGREQAPTSEHEPNDSPAEATLLTLDRPIEGKVGKRVAEGTPDLDYFRLPFSKSTRAVSARLSGIPGVDLVLELYDGQGAAIAKSDARGAGGGEWLQPTLVGPGEAFLLVRQLWTQGSPVIEDVPDAYKLSVHFGPPEAEWETEPNDTPATATPFQSPTRRQRGYLGSPDDRDWYSFASLAPGTYIASVTAPTGVEVVILSADGPAEDRAPGADRGRGGRDEGRSSPGAGPAKVAKRVPAGEREQTKFQVRPGKPTYIGVARKLEVARDSKERDRDAKDARDPKEQSLGGLDEAYEISIEAVRD